MVNNNRKTFGINIYTHTQAIHSTLLYKGSHAACYLIESHLENQRILHVLEICLHIYVYVDEYSIQRDMLRI